MQQRKTKIICTVGPATDNDEVMRGLMAAGMNVARLNFSHGTQAEHQKRIDQLKRLRGEVSQPVALLIDTRGPEIRIRKFKNGKITLKEGQTFVLTPEEVEGDEEQVSITYPNLYQDVYPGASILIDDGLIELSVNTIDADNRVICRVVSGGEVSNSKSINLPGIDVKMPYMNDKDEQDIIFAIQNGFDFVAASFVRCKEDVLAVRRVLEENNGEYMKIISKIENGTGVEQFDEILKVTDAVMIARGDMGVEIPIEQIPGIQKELIKKTKRAGKIAITATQMLDSMIRNPRPTRAETTDVANAVYDETSAIMLSGETAVGKYPVEAVTMMDKIARCTEASIDYKKRFKNYNSEGDINITNAISLATVTAAHNLEAAAIVTVTKSGYTGRMVSKHRPACPIVAATSDEISWRQLALSWGVIPFLIEEKESTDELFDIAVETAMKSGVTQSGDIIVISAGVPVGVRGTTNLLKIHMVGNVLVKGERVNEESCFGTLCVCKNAREAEERFKDGDILVIPKTTNDLMPLLRRAKAIITEEGGLSSHGAIVGLSLNIPVVAGAHEATSLLKTGMRVTVDSSRGLVLAGHEE